MGKVNEQNIALLITGTIVPNSNYVAHTDVDQRRGEYMDGLIFYRSQFPRSEIFFLENSAHDLQVDKHFDEVLKQHRISLLKFPVSDKFSEGKGYQEFEMLDAAVNQLGNSYDHLVKITGRYQVKNIKRLMPDQKNEMTADSHKKHKITQTNVFFVRPAFYKQNLLGAYLEADDSKGKFIEHVVYSRLVKRNLLDKVGLFAENPIITGFSGSYGGTLQRNEYKMMLRNVERKFLRTLGFHQFVVEY